MAINNPYSNEPTSKTAEKLLNIQEGTTKQDRLMIDSAKKQTLMNGGLAPTEADFSILNPNATLEDQALFRQQSGIRQNQEKLQALFDNRAQSIFQPSTLGDDALDVVNSVAQGGIALGETLYGAADYASRNNLGTKAYELATGESVTSLDEATDGFSTVFNDVRKEADNLYKSDSQAAIDDRRQRYDVIETEISEEQKVKDVESGDNEIWAEAKNIARQTGNTADSLLSNPSQIVLGALEELPTLISGGLIGKQAVSMVSKGVANQSSKKFLQSDKGKDLIKEFGDEIGVQLLAKDLGEIAARKFIKTKAGQEASKKAATAAGVGSGAIEEAMSNAMQTKSEVLALNEEQVKDEPAYKAFREKGMSHEKALQELSQKAFDLVTAMVLPTAGAVSKITGAGSLEGSIFLKGSALGNTITKNLGAVGIEGIEEGIQSGTGQTFQNIAAQETFESDRSTTKGVGAAIGEGAIIGGATGGILGSFGLVGESAVSATEDTKKLLINADKVIKKGAETLARATDTPAVKEARKTGDTSKVTDVASKTYNPEQAFTALASKEFFPVPNNANNESTEDFDVRADAYEEQLTTHINNQREKVQDIIKKAGETQSPELAKSIKTEIDTLKNMSQTFEGLSGVLGNTNFDSAIKELKSNPENKDILLGSISKGIDSSLSIQQAEEILSTAPLTDVERKQVESFIQVKKSTQDVSAVVKNGDKQGNLGLNQYTQLINDAVNTGNADNARTVLNQLSSFATSQVDKAKKVRQAFNEVKSSDDPKANQFPSGKSWKLDIRKSSPEQLITNIEKDAESIVATFNSLKAYSVAKFGNTQEQVNDIRTENTGSDGSGVSNTTRSEQPNNVSGRNESEEQSVSGIPRRDVTSTEQNGTSNARRTGNDDAVTLTNEVEQVPPTATQEGGASETEVTDTKSFDSNPTTKTFSNRNRTVVEGQLRDIQFRAVYDKKGKLTTLKTKVAGIRTYMDSPIVSKNYPAPTIDDEMGAVTDIINSIDPDFNEENVNENTQQSNGSEQNTNQQDESKAQTQETADGIETTGNADAVRELKDAMQKTSTGILATGRKYANRLSTLFKVKVKDNKINKTTDLFNELNTLEGVTEEQRKALERIGKFKEVMTTAIDKLIKLKPELTSTNPYAAVDKNMIQLLMSEGNDTLSEGLDPNVLNLMAIAGLKWLATRGKETLNRTPSDVASMLGISENAMSKEVLEYYLNKGIPSYLVSDNIGKDVVKALGLSLDKNNAPRETQNRMSQSIGGVVFAAMHEMGLLESELAENIPNVNGEFINDSFESNQEGKGKTIKMTKLMENPISSAAIGLFNKVENVLESITSIENDFKMPSLEAPTTTVTKNQRGTQDLTESQKKALLNYGQKAFKLNTEAIMMFDLVGDDVLKTAMGYDFSLRDQNGKLSSNKTHATKLIGAKGKNNQIERSIENLKAFKQHLLENGEEGIDSDFFFESVVDNNNRFRINNKIVNPQGDKLHRAAINMDGWEYTVNDERSRNLYLLALGQSLGVKIDKLEVGDSIANTMQVLAKPQIKRAITALQRLRNGEPRTIEATKTLQKIIQDGVTEAGEGSHSLEGLISYMDYSETLPFESTLSIEIDGITNGTALATLLFAQDGSEETLAKSGIFSDSERSYGKYISNPSNLDNYETVASGLTAELNAIIAGTWTDAKGEPFNPKLVGLLRPIGNILGKLNTEGDDTYGLVRNVAKNPVLIGNYGAGVSKITSEFVEEVLNKIYDHIQTAVNDKDQSRLDLLYKELSTVFPKKALPKLTLANALSWEMDKTQTSIFKTRVSQTFGKIMNSALEKQFAPLKEARDSFNTMLNAANAMFRAAYDVESNKIIKDKGFLTVADEEFIARRLAPLKPEIKHGQVLENDNRNTHIPLNTTELRVNRKSRFATEVDFNVAPANHPNDGARQIYSPEQQYTGNGVKGTVFTVQSTDSAIMVDTLLEDYPALNIYDAVIVNPLYATQAGKVLNKSTINITKRTKVYRDTAESLKRIMTLFTKNEEYIAELQNSNYLEKEVIPFNTVAETNPMDMVREAMRQTNLVEVRRKNMFDNIEHTLQYNFEGAGYSTSGEERGSEYYVKQFISEVKDSNISSLGSTPESGNTSYSQSMVEHEAKANNIVGLMAMLSKISGVKSTVKHATYLAELLGDTYNSFVATTKIKVAQGGKLNAGDYNLTTGDVRIAVKAGGRTNSFEMGADEVFAHEMIHSMTVAGLQTDSLFSREIRKLFEQAKKSLVISDFQENGITLAEAKTRYDYIFNNSEKVNGYSSGVFEFVAYGLTNEKFREILSDKVNPNINPNATDTSFLGKLRALYSRLLDILTNRVLGSTNLTADEKLKSLVGQMMQHETNAKQQVYNASIVDKVESGIKAGLINYIQQPLVDFLAKDAFTQDSTSENRAVRSAITVGQGLAAVGRITLTGKFGEFRTVINKVSKRLGATENNLFTALLNEMQGRTAETNKFYELTRESRKAIDQARADIASSVKSHVKKQFKRELSSEEEQALTKVLVKTDMSSLTANFSAEQIFRLITDSNYLTDEIRKAQQSLNKFGLNATYYRKQANSLANFMVTGLFTEKFALKNAHAISRLVGLNKNVPVRAAEAEIEIDTLTSLQALQIAKNEIPKDMSLVEQIFNEEFSDNTNPEDNGIMFTLLYHSDYKERALKELFGGNPMQTVKGYTREIYNPNKSFQVAPEADVNLMAKDGFVRVGTVAKDPADPNALPMAMYISDMGQLAPWQSGGVSLASMTAKGSKYYDTVANTNAPNNMTPNPVVAKTIRTRKEQAAKDIYAGITSSIPRTTLVPILDETGQVTDFHYLMQESTKDLLERNIQLSDVLGAMEGNMKSKVSGKEVNSNFVEALTDDYKSNYANNRDQYSFVGLNSERSDLEELYKMMPFDMRAEIKASTGQDGIWVRDEIIKLVFGQRKFSVAHYFKEKAQLRDANTAMSNKYLTEIYRKLGTPRVAKIEQGWQEVIAFVKDTIVIKSITTLLGNVASNNVLLWSMGVSVKDIVSNQERAVRYAEVYQANQERLDEINRQIAVNNKKQNSLLTRNSIKALEIEKTALEDKQLTNPINGLIEAGIYQSIIDDVDMLDDGFNYKTRIEDWVSPVTDKIPSQLKTLTSYVTLSQDNKFYQFLRRTTQLSDFAARFALHEHNLKKGMNSQDSINMIVDVFIDYDLPTHKGIEYLNSIGGVFFTKFFLRIQKVILHTLKNSPARFFGLHYLQELFGNISDIFDSFGLTKDLGFMFKTPIGALGGIVDMHPIINIIK